MPSTARDELASRLADVTELILAHTALTGGGKGRPAKRQGAAITRAGIVLLSAATEAFVEELFEEASRIQFRGMSDADFDRLFGNTSQRLNNADVHKTEMLFFNLGMPWALKNIRWRKFSNETLRDEINRLTVTRNRIAHGRGDSITLQSLKRWKNMIELFAPQFEAKVSAHILGTTGRITGW